MSREVEKLINHPVHIDEEGTIPSSFIPFCSFAGQMKLFGETLSNFQVPVCRLFTEKIVNGQVCYEADISRHKKNVTHWDEALHGGLNLIIDTNHEYDIKNLFFETENSNTVAIQENFETYKLDVWILISTSLPMAKVGSFLNLKAKTPATWYLSIFANKVNCRLVFFGLAVGLAFLHFSNRSEFKGS